MHIAIDARLTYYREGGIAAYMRRVIQALAGLDPSGDYTILRSRKDNRSLAAGQNFRQVPIWTPCHHRLEAWTLGLELLPRRVDLLHSPDFIPPRWGARQYVITVHDLNFLHYPQFLTPESRRYYNDQIERAVRQADHILADSEATKTDLVAMLGVPAEQISVHMLGVDEAFRPLPDADLDAACAQLDLPRGYLLFVSTFEPRKNIPGLLEAYRYLRDRLPDAPPLVLAGRRGWLADDLAAQVKKLDLEEHIRWRENVPQALMPALYGAASLLAAPSFYEGFGLSALEAMACGTPTVVANRSSLPEVVGEAGLLVDPNDVPSITDGLHRVLTDSTLAARLRADGLARARTFTWERTARVVLDVYRRLAA